MLLKTLRNNVTKTSGNYPHFYIPPNLVSPLCRKNDGRNDAGESTRDITWGEKWILPAPQQVYPGGARRTGDQQRNSTVQRELDLA